MTDQDLRVLINGAPIGQLGKYYALAYGWQTIPLENIERIEVIRGAGSVEYGNTLVGTINIITKKGGKDIRSTASVNYGTFNDFKADATNSGSVGKFNWAVGGGYPPPGRIPEQQPTSINTTSADRWAWTWPRRATCN